MFPILISRHGQVVLSKPKFPTRAEFEAYLAAYEWSDLTMAAYPRAELVRHVCEATNVFARPSPRARESLQLLVPGRMPIVDAVFREEPQIVPNVAGRWPLLVWFTLTRGIGSFHSKEFDSRLTMCRRADVATERLIEAARQGPVALVGHGWFNRAIARALVRNGWHRTETRGGLGAFGRMSLEWG